MLAQNITELSAQKELKPKIEDVLPCYISGEKLDNALSFISYLRANKMKPTWAGIHNAWKSTYKGKAICYIRLFNDSWKNSSHLRDKYGKHSWVITPYIEENMAIYSETILNEGLQDFIWTNVHHCMRCRVPCHGKNPPHKDVMVLGKEVTGLCHGRPLVWAFDPNKVALDSMKRLLELEQCARDNS